MSIANAPAACGAYSQNMAEIVNECLPTVKFLASRLASRVPPHVDVDDLVQVGLIGLLQSAERFDPHRGVKFQTYANRRVQGAMLDHLRSLDWKPRSVRKRSREMETACHAAEQRLGARATQEDVARQMGMSLPELGQWTDTFSICSFQDHLEEKDATDHLASLPDPADSPEATFEKEQMRQVLIQTIDQLPEKERLVLSLYYYEQLNMQEIGQVLGLRQARVSQLHSQAVLRLRKKLCRTNHLRSQSPFQAA